MSCEVAKSPFSDQSFPNSFDSNTGHDGDGVDLSALATFDPNSFNNVIDQSCVDPNTLSNHAGSGSPADPFDPILTPDFTTDIYTPDFNAIQPSPYFQSIEQQQQHHHHQQQQPQPFGDPFIPSALRNQHHQTHRRSVSEPPGNALMHHGQGQSHLPPSDALMIFHRDGHKLGVPRSAAAPMTKKGKQTRAAPYQHRTPHQSPAQQHQQPHAPQSTSRYQLRRAYTQQQQSAVQRPPTSAPHNMPPAPFHQSPQQHQQMPQHIPFDQMPPLHQEPQYVSSRVCTPAPEAVDPFLCSLPPATSTGTPPAFNNVGGNVITPQQQQQQQQQSSPENLVVVKMGVNELRALITEVVQKAVKGLRAAEGEVKTVATDAGMDLDADAVCGVAAVSDAKGVGFQEEEGEVGDDIVVAGSFATGGSGEEGEHHDHEFSIMREE